MQRADCDTQSVCSSRPSGSNPIVKKRRFQRFSIRQLFYASPLMGRPRRWSKKKGSVEGDARSESSLSTYGAGGGAGSGSDRDCGDANRAGGGSAGVSVIGRKESARLQAACNASQSSDPESYSVSSQTPLKLNTDVESQLLECPLCLSELPLECFPKLTSCSHRSCLDCLRQYLKIEINESRVNICCPECTEPIHPTDIRMILNDDYTMNKYEEYTLRRILAKDPDTRWCPAPDCSFAVIAAGCASCPRLQCERPGCFTTFCYHCKQEWHPNQTCDAARAQRSPNIRASSVSFGQDSVQRDDIKPCPRCQVLIVKMDDGSCNHMTCAVCGAEFCWLCMKEISDLHYLSPSGCTFWGKKPWSRKKKILWQLGTLVGAPVGIALVAGIAVPAIIIGVPVWVGRKLHARYEASSKHKRNLAITGGVTASILISPILASLAVGIGVPILLAYVYGVVPISLCRSGGCGVSTSSTGVRIEFDDENDLASGTAGQTQQDAQSVDTSSHRVGNPSIGEVSFGMSASLSMGSGSHLERMGVIRDSDRESASNTAIAGASLTGSMSSGMAGGANGHRLEVQADVASNKRFSFSSETASATASLSERSTTMSLADDASTRALAGSIIGSRDPSTSFTPVEVHVDATMSPIGGSQDSVISHSKRRESALDCAHDESASIGRTESRGKHKFNAADRPSLQNYDGESSGVWSKDDTSSERVRFDENVSFIDDMPSDDFPSVPSASGGTTVAEAISPLTEMAETWPEPRKSVSLGGSSSVDDCLKHKGLPQTSFSSRTLWHGLAAESCSNRLGETEFSKYNGRNAKITDIGNYTEVRCGLTSALKNCTTDGEMSFVPLCKSHIADHTGSRLPRSLSSSSTVQEEIIEMGSDCDEVDSAHEQVFYDAPEQS